MIDISFCLSNWNFIIGFYLRAYLSIKKNFWLRNFSWFGFFALFWEIQIEYGNLSSRHQEMDGKFYEIQYIMGKCKALGWRQQLFSLHPMCHQVAKAKLDQLFLVKNLIICDFRRVSFMMAFSTHKFLFPTNFFCAEVANFH